MYLIALVLFFAITVFTTLFCGSSPMDYFDTGTLIMLLVCTIPMLTASGLIKDLKTSFQIMVKGSSHSFNKKQLSRSLEAVTLTTQLVLCSGFLTLFIQLISSLFIYNQNKLTIHTLAVSISISCLAPAYAIFFTIFLLPVKSRLKALLLDMEA